ncbi:GtrA family protein [Metabacillus litoralis]|uniref:GtrA family protein n=1 Tax=Metabacillus TaxID=2675233 RepID=UPI000EF60E31|nr:GtrA family protein [Metabacillus litoralis]
MTLNRLFIIKFIKYSFVGIICTLIYFLSMFIFVEFFHQQPVIGASISFIIMTLFSYLLNKKYTFGGKYSHQQLLRFLVVSIIGFTLNFVIIFTVVNVLSFHYAIGEIVTILVIPLINFTLNNIWTFK